MAAVVPLAGGVGAVRGSDVVGARGVGRTAERRGDGVCSRSGVATFLTWPVWIGPLVADARRHSCFMHRELAWRQRTAGPGHRPRARWHRAVIVRRRSSPRTGSAWCTRSASPSWPTPRTLGAAVHRPGNPGFLSDLSSRTGSRVALLFLAIVLQARRLIVTGLNSGATTRRTSR